MKHPNALIVYTHRGLEVLNLLSGAPIVSLNLAEEKTAFADINEDGTLERVKTNFEDGFCDAEVVTLQPTAQVFWIRLWLNFDLSTIIMETCHDRNFLSHGTWWSLMEFYQFCPRILKNVCLFLLTLSMDSKSLGHEKPRNSQGKVIVKHFAKSVETVVINDRPFVGCAYISYSDQRPYIIETMHSYVLLIWAAAIPADRWCCSLWLTGTPLSSRDKLCPDSTLPV